jgi:hypothetical protein
MTNIACGTKIGGRSESYTGWSGVKKRGGFEERSVEMSKRRWSWVALATVAVALLLGAHLWTARSDNEKSAVAQSERGYPAGSSKAVASFHRAFPGATLHEVVRPEDELYAGSAEGLPLYWTFRFESDGRQKEVPITPDGLVVRKDKDLRREELPKTVAQALDREAQGAIVKEIRRQETLATLKYVALKEPDVVYLVTVEKDGEESQVAVAADGTVQRVSKRGEQGEGPEEEESEATAPAANEQLKEITIPEEAAKAVRAVKKVYPQAVVQAVENVAYDDGTGNVEAIYYEVEFPLNGKPKTVLATPDGVILQLNAPAEVKAAPEAVLKAAAEKIPGAAIKAVTREETRAGLKFVALDKPRVVYVADLEGTDKERSVRFAPDGKKVEPFNPWGDR